MTTPTREELLSNQSAAEIAGLESASGHLSQRVDEAAALAEEAIELMTRFHSHAQPDGTPDMNAVFPARHFRNFVDDHARLMFKLNQFQRDQVDPAFLRLKKAADQVCAVLGAHGQISARDDRVQTLMDCLYETDPLKSVYAALLQAQGEPAAKFQRLNKGGSGEFVSVDWLVTPPDSGTLYTAPPSSDQVWNEAIEKARNWLRRNANAEKDQAKRAAFIEAHNAVLSLKRPSQAQEPSLLDSAQSSECGLLDSGVSGAVDEPIETAAKQLPTYATERGLTYAEIVNLLEMAKEGHTIQHNQQFAYWAAAELLKVQQPAQQSIAAAIEYPDEWDTAAYPTLESALHELAAWQRTSAKIAQQAPAVSDDIWELAHRYTTPTDGGWFFADGDKLKEFCRALRSRPATAIPEASLLNSIVEAARCLGVAQEKGDKSAAGHWANKVDELVRQPAAAPVSEPNMPALIAKARKQIAAALPEDEPDCVPDWVCELLIKVGAGVRT